jgi:hypothetical protein
MGFGEVKTRNNFGREFALSRLPTGWKMALVATVTEMRKQTSSFASAA